MSRTTSKFVLDSSAVLACLRDKPGSSFLVDELADGIMSSVNLAETIGVLIRQGASSERAREILGLLDIEVIDFDRPLAEQTGELVEKTRSKGLSLGDRACLALAKARGLPAITADRSWSGIDVGVTIQLIR